MHTTSIKASSLLSVILFILLIVSKSFASPQTSEKGIPHRIAAEYIHDIIESNRTIYSQFIVERLGEAVGLQATENWETSNTLMLPAQFLSLSSKISNKRGTGMHYRLLSLWPINKENSPKPGFEKKGLESVGNKPEKPHFGFEERGGHWYFRAVYPDKAVTKACVNCHNQHPKSPKSDFKLGDVMGGIVITLPLGTEKKEFLPPEVVADYVHSILESDRTVYAKHIVNRLQKNNVISATENWWEENTLLLPAQFLLNASDLIRNHQSQLDFRLISLWPINKHNGAANEFERSGLESVAHHPLRPYIGRLTLGEKKYFQAIYPDLAVTPACVSCHNAHPNSPKHDFKLFDVMGGIVVTLPTQ